MYFFVIFVVISLFKEKVLHETKLKFCREVKPNNGRKDYWDMYNPLFINNILTATSL